MQFEETEQTSEPDAGVAAGLELSGWEISAAVTNALAVLTEEAGTVRGRTKSSKMGTFGENQKRMRETQNTVQ